MADHPVNLVVTDDLVRNRWTVGFRGLLAISHYIWLGLWTVLAFFAAFFNWVGVIVLGRSPAPLHRFLAAYVKYVAQLYAYLRIAANPYPSFDGPDGYPVDLQIAPPAPQSRLTALFRIVLAAGGARARGPGAAGVRGGPAAQPPHCRVQAPARVPTPCVAGAPGRARLPGRDRQLARHADLGDAPGGAAPVSVPVPALRDERLRVPDRDRQPVPGFRGRFRLLPAARNPDRAARASEPLEERVPRDPRDPRVRARRGLLLAPVPDRDPELVSPGSHSGGCREGCARRGRLHSATRRRRWATCCC